MYRMYIYHVGLSCVFSQRKGVSLYEYIHVKSSGEKPGSGVGGGEKPGSGVGGGSVFSSLQVARQISQAMGYLHAKGVVVQTLCSRNVSLEPKVKLCLMDHSFPEARFQRLVTVFVQANLHV